MGLFLVYILKAAFCLAAFYLFYRLLLSRETLHRFNRFALLGVLVLSCVLPLIEVNVEQGNDVGQTVLSLEQWLMMLASASMLPAGADAGAGEGGITWVQVLLLAYVAGVAFFVLRNVYSLLRLLSLLRTARREDIRKYVDTDIRVVLLVHERDIAPFSWMRFIVIARKDLEEDGRAILLHELAHVRSGHSWDLLLADLCIFLQWFNPAAWLLKQELQSVHEYEADEAVIASGVNAKEYQLLIIKKAVGTRLYSMANSFNHSKLKKRITMMTKKKSSKWACAKYLYVLPLAAVAVVAFARPEVSGVANEIAAAKVSDLAAVVKTMDGESVPATATLPSDTLRKKSVQVYVLNGKMAGEKDINQLSPDSIVSIRVHKDSVTLEKYGMKGDAAIVMVNTDRQADEGKVLYIVDGQELGEDALNSLAPGDIASMQVLKDEASLAKYGAEGQSAVILITMKKAEDAKLTATGIVKAEDGEPMPGVIVLEAGTKNGTVTGMDGRFELHLSSPESKLSLQYVGFQTLNVKAGTDLQLVMKPE